MNIERSHKPLIDTEPPLEKALPKGPFRKTNETSRADLLLFVPRNEIGRLIDVMTGRYGYSHLAIDLGEMDIPTSRRVMIESTVQPGVHYAFLDEYGDRPFVRIPLQNTGMDVRDFEACIKSQVGDRFDDLEIFTFGILDNPARQICSDVATVCLPDEMRNKIIRCHLGTVLHPLSAVRDPISGYKTRLFVSPNGYAEFFDAPRGRLVHAPDRYVEPILQDDETESLLPKLWKLADAAILSGWKAMNDLLGRRRHPLA
jgi:hypothetical protein